MLLSGIAWHSAWISHFGSLMHRYMLLQLIELTHSTLSQETINYTVSTRGALPPLLFSFLDCLFSSEGTECLLYDYLFEILFHFILLIISF